METGAYQSMQAQNIHPVVTEIASIEEALSAYLAGKLHEHLEKLH